MFRCRFSKKQWVLGVATFVMLNGCAATKPNKENVATITKSELEHLQQAAQQWQEAKDGVKRLLKIEKDLSVLISQLDGLVKQQITQQAAQNMYAVSDTKMPDSSSKQQSSGKSEVINPATPVVHSSALEATAVKTNQRAPANLSAKTSALKYALQLSSVTQKSRLDNLIPDLKAKLPKTLGENLNIETAQVNNVTFYRLKAGGYVDKQQALDVCTNLKAKSINCIVSLFDEQSAKTRL
ncbi:SPOR domain-containing protein [Pseudoalteromonas sp. JBTF-M23]|uniref:SPOR domain-containing protein n=1 Tax=Pseudoalteromonas caenipelagi TaxID=2726988 RepID=A0A849VD87_9GAMM|nr:SPOR domain-containing protein [Pseudoalteromonas caenipelagi]NOU50750.1 SPOR domain-containing protein [Pseudoalteromonas caenipelagi]